MGDHQERKISMPPIGFTSVVLPQPHHQNHPSSLPAANDQADGGGGGGYGGNGGSAPQVPKRNLDYSRTQMRDCRGDDSDSDSESESDPDLDPATLLTKRMASSSPYFKTLSQLVPQQPQPPPPLQEQQLVSPPRVDPTVVRYRECQKNHAAAMGSHVVDGCGEFMPNGEEGTAEALKCAACSCHRNFHRREVEGELIHQSAAAAAANGNNNNNHEVHDTSGSRRREAAYHNNHGQVAAPFHPPRLPQRFPPLMMAFGGGGNGAPAESSSEHLNSPHGTPGTTTTAALAGTPPSSSSRKRFRTKFSQEQKDKMQEFGERLGWKIQKQDEQQVQEFCAEVGVKRQVFKVWMHNCKQASKKKQL